MCAVFAKKTPKAPLKQGVAKVPVIMQMEAVECAATCLAMILAYYGKWLSLSKVREDCGISRDGANVKDVLNAARSYGLKAQGCRYEPDSLRRIGGFPCVIHWDFMHFVVLCGFKGDKAVINDPSAGRIVVSKEEFDRSYTGICIMAEPTESFVADGEQKTVLEFARNRLQGSTSALVIMAITSLIAAIIGIVNPLFSDVFIDELLGGSNTSWLPMFLALLVIIGVMQVVNSFISIVSNRRIAGKFAVTANAQFLWHVMRLPMEFFAQRLPGDICARQDTNEDIAHSLISQLAPILFNSVMVVLYATVMVWYSPLLAAIGLASLVANAFVSRYVSLRRMDISRVQMRDAGKLHAATLAGIEMIETIKSSGAESGFFGRWAGYQANVNRQNVQFAKVNQYFGALPQLVTSVANVIVLMLGVLLTIHGEFTAGSILAFQGLMTALSLPMQQIVNAGQSLQEMRASMERIDDVMEYPIDAAFEVDDACAAGGTKAPDGAGQVEVSEADGRNMAASSGKLLGSVCMRNVSFGYARLSDPFLKDFNLTVEPGQSVAIVGPSGCGKSTVCNLLTGMVRPWSGDILFDGVPISEIPHVKLTSSLAVVDQDIKLFAGTIRDNLKMWDDTIDDVDMYAAAQDACIHSDIMQRDGGYGYRVLEGAKDFSGGQRQRLEIARVLTQKPSVIVLDEATSALDAVTEYEVVQAIKARHIACVVIAHRLSTIRDCDEIIVLDHGRVVERGRHDDLVALGGTYAALVEQQ